ncbi:MAG: sugar-binding domain-containing protein [Dermabacteraceae bacterium]
MHITLSTQLASQFSLRSALVVAVSGTTEDDVRGAIAAVTAKFLQDNVKDGDIIGATPGRTMVRASRLVDSLPTADVVQLTGVGNSRVEDGVEAVLNLGRASSGETYPLYALPQRVAIGGGAGKHDAVLAVLRSGLADVVITDVESARYALERDGVAG